MDNYVIISSFNQIPEVHQRRFLSAGKPIHLSGTLQFVTLKIL
jgi:hypothetical protein